MAARIVSSRQSARDRMIARARRSGRKFQRRIRLDFSILPAMTMCVTPCVCNADDCFANLPQLQPDHFLRVTVHGRIRNPREGYDHDFISPIHRFPSDVEWQSHRLRL